MRGLRWGVGLAVAALAFGAAGCSGASDQASISAGFIARAAESTNEQDTARVAMTMEIAGQHLDVDGVMAMDGSALAMTIALPGGGELEERLVDGVMYMRIPGAASELGSEWVSVDMAGLLPEQQAATRSSNGGDPAATLDALRAANGEVQTLGRDDLRGGAGTHYRVHLEADTALERASKAFGRPLTDAQVEVIRKMDGEPVDVWIDDQGRVLQEQFAMTLPQGRVDLTMELYDFGVPVHVEAPPASDTTDITDRVRAGVNV